MKRKDLLVKLSEEQTNKISEFGIIRQVASGERLVKVGDRNHDFFVVLEGAIGIYDENNTEILIHHAGEFTGNSDSISGRTSVFNAVAESSSTILQLSQNQLKEIISRNQELSEVLLRAFLLRRVYEIEKNIGPVKLIGSRYSPETFTIREFLSKNHIQFTWIDLEQDEIAENLLAQFHIQLEETPVIIASQAKIYKNPSLKKIAEVLGLSFCANTEVFDLVVVGAGPAGLAASVYASSEGLKVMTIDSVGPGGQAGASAKIENYLGFPMGISGSDLANQAYVQAQKFGCSISIPWKAKSLSFKNNAFQLELESGDRITSSTVIAATGARYGKLPLPNLCEFEGRGVYYGATPMEAQLISGKEIIIVGGGNSAGQAAIFLTSKSAMVHLVIRGKDLEKSMSAYLLNRIVNNPKIVLHINSEVTALIGDTWLRKVVIRSNVTQEQMTYDISNLFLFLGALPCSDWLIGTICLDKNGFVCTGRDIPGEALEQYQWPLKRTPQSLETCIPGLFAVGDIRHGSVKRVASAVGEGSMAISQVHTFLSKVSNH